MKNILPITFLSFLWIIQTAYSQAPLNDNPCNLPSTFHLGSSATDKGPFSNVGSTPDIIIPASYYAESFNRSIWFTFDVLDGKNSIELFIKGKNNFQSIYASIFSDACTSDQVYYYNTINNATGIQPWIISCLPTGRYNLMLSTEVNEVTDFTISLKPINKVYTLPSNDSPSEQGPNPAKRLMLDEVFQGSTCCAKGTAIDVNELGNYCDSDINDDAVWFTYVGSNEKSVDITVNDLSLDFTLKSLSVYRNIGDKPDSIPIGLNVHCTKSFQNQVKLSCFSPGELVWIKLSTTGGNCMNFNIQITKNTTLPQFAETCLDVKDVIKIKHNHKDSTTLKYTNWKTEIAFSCPDDLNTDCEKYSSTVWHKIVVDSQATQLVSHITTEGMNSVSYSYYYGACDNLTPLYDNAKLKNKTCFVDTMAKIGLIKGVYTYYMSISTIGRVELPAIYPSLCTTSKCVECLSSESCIPETTWSVTKRSSTKDLDDPLFCPGEEVTACVKFEYNKNKIGSDWLQGLIPDFGLGWDVDNSKLSTPQGFPFSPIWLDDSDVNCLPKSNVNLDNVCYSFDPNTGVRKLCHMRCDVCNCTNTIKTNDRFPRGWYWNTPVDSIAPVSCNPNDNYGIGKSNVNVKLCVDLKVKTFDTEDECYQNKDLAFHFLTTSDGVTGAWKDNVASCFLDYKQLGPKWEVDCRRTPKILGNDIELCHEGKVEIDLSNEEGLFSLKIDVVPIDNPHVTGETSFVFNNGQGTIDDYLVNTGDQIEIVEYLAYGSVQDILCNSIPDTFRVTIMPELKVTFNDPYYICYGSSGVKISPNISGGSGIYSGTLIPYEPAYVWSTGQNIQSVNVSPLAEECYSLTVTDNIGCKGEGIACVIPSIVEFDVDTGLILVCVTHTDSILINVKNVEVIGNEYTVSWDIPTGISAVPMFERLWINLKESSPTFSPYSVSAIVTDTFGCQSAKDIVVIILDTAYFYIDTLVVSSKDEIKHNITNQHFIPSEYSGFKLLAVNPQIKILSSDTLGNIEFRVESDSSQIFEIKYQLCDGCRCKELSYYIDYYAPSAVVDPSLDTYNVVYRQGELHINNVSSQDAKLYISDALGRIVYSGHIKQNPISTQNLIPGLYHISIVDKTNVISKSIFISH